ncbi:MAG TPA: hypothetical protein VK489_14430, partial [Ferruginibacter sp.]|nr:hypothetical protein [Ferruginibacter sp.]
MRKTYLIISAAIVATGFTACKETVNEEARHDATSFTAYVDSVEALTPVYTTANWTAIENGYQDRVTRAELALANLEAEDRERAEKAKERYAALRARYEVKIKESEAAVTPSTSSDYRVVVRNRLFGEGKLGADMSYNFVTPANALEVYRNFVTTVEDNKSTWTREDWDEIKVLWEALDTRKNQIEKDLPSGDNLKIAAQKTKFATTMAI